MHEPTCIFWANLTPFSLKAVAVGLALAEMGTDGALCVAVARTALDSDLFFG